MSNREMRQIDRISTWHDLRAKIISEVEASGTIYIRWSRDPRRDETRGYSLNHASHTSEGGLSVQTIDQSDLGHSWDDITIALYLTDYYYAGPVCSLWAGEIVGKGGDNEDVIGNAKLLAIVDVNDPELRQTLSDLRVRGGNRPLK